MKITDVKLGILRAPLRVPFKTALRSVDSIEDVVVEIHTDTGNVGYGEAPPTGAITGETTGSIIAAFKDHINKTIIGRDIDDLENLLIDLNKCIVKNTSAKAACDMAIYDLYGQLYKIPVHKLLGSSRKNIETDITISVNPPDIMAADAIYAVEKGYDVLKVKVGIDHSLDVERLVKIREAVGDKPKIRIDANQAWTPKEAVRILDKMQENLIDLELVEQPVIYHDLEGLKYVTDNSTVPVLADESVFSPEDALEIVKTKSADMINIKLMKCGGIYNALKITSLAELAGVECMLGCMLEAKISVNAAVHLACAKQIITKFDLDGPILCTHDPVIGGSVFEEKDITVSNDYGLGIKGIEDIEYID
ncbi:dipeptide epimerase [Peptoniphilus sp.]|jgi:L-alanine-DL-glutamate epimerase-like enolase superfamily enzyme|uniref:dipeptide epimerase n=1 Tax=Peptoniphilus sp. TaxID=1971214 RepID=UPI003D8E088F